MPTQMKRSGFLGHPGASKGGAAVRLANRRTKSTGTVIFAPKRMGIQAHGDLSPIESMQEEKDRILD